MSDEIATVEHTEADIQKANEEIDTAYRQIADLISSGVPAVTTNFADNADVLLHTLALHSQLVKAMQEAQTLIDTALIELNKRDEFIPFGGKPVEGIGYVEIHRTGDKKRTDNPLIAGLVKKRLTVDCAVDDETGEVNEQASKAVAKAVDTMMQLTGATTESFNSWRKRAAKALDIDINKYETREGGRLKVTIK